MPLTSYGYSTLIVIVTSGRFYMNRANELARSAYMYVCRNVGFSGLGVACWPLVPKFAGSNPAEAVGFLRGEKILRTPSFGGEVKPSVPCRRFAACKRSLNGKITGQHSHPQFPLPPLGSLTSWRTWRHLVVKSGNI